MNSTTTARVAVRPPLRRPTTGRRLAGVAAGLADHLGWPVMTVRLLFVVAGLAAGAGVVFYLWLALTVPSGEASDTRPPRLVRLVPVLREQSQQGLVGQVALAVVLLVIAAALLATRAGIDGTASWLLPVVVLLCGAGLGWSQLDAIERERSGLSPSSKGRVLVRVGGGLTLAIVGVVLLIGQGQSPGQMVSGLIAAVVVLAGAALVLAPWWLRLWRELIAVRADRAREAERADIAAHLHDSVLQTLSLIRARSHQPEVVQRLARAQERELRDWLYRDRPEPGDSVAADLRRIAAEVEDLHGVPIDVVTAGDRTPDDSCRALAAATRESLVNAVVHGEAPVSLFVQINDQGADVYVRDRGDGFDLDDIAPDRHGVRDSIITRMLRHGGTADVRTGQGRGTEIHLHLPATKDT